MLSFEHAGPRLCDGLPRREWLRIGLLGGVGAAASVVRPAAAAASMEGVAGFRKAKRVIMLFMLGGPPQHETWDPKPDAPEEIRGPFQPIATATPGLHVCELMPKTAALTDRIAVLRAMATDDNAHSSSGYWVLTGTPHAPKNQENALPGAPNDRPSLAAVVRHLHGDPSGLPGAVRLPDEIWNTGRIVWPGQDAGWLGAHADPWLVSCEPQQPDFRVPDIALPVSMSPERLGQRLALKQLLDRKLASLESAAVARWAAWQSKAVDLLQDAATRKAFAIDEEPAAVRERYGTNRFGQSVLLARRLAEAGVSLVQVNWTRWEHDEDVAPAWDTHAKNAERCKNDLVPPMDLAYSALLEDLEQRGMLNDTLVVWVGEFGRSPKINPSGGRDHWGHVFSAALAGGGVQGGAVYGASDRQGGYPLDGRVEPQDLAATIYHCLGYAAETEVHDQTGRPFAISKGQPIWDVL
ncbi:MAG: DUF1501 domain-containing protein [Pirellulales bacterium]|nr:DUF1501 domain-containing protein [Pirellulales bacterium]MBL7194353.1 DUF1501 domain-containing protein [Pirellulales bacterium]